MKSGASVLVDTGPLVALFDPSDADHRLCKDQLSGLAHHKLITSLAVVTEASYLLAFSVQAQQALLTFIAADALELAEFSRPDIARAAALVHRYADLPMDFADATLVVLAERLKCVDVFTLDRRDFSVYRVGRRGFRILPEG